MAGLFTSSEQDMLGNIIQQRSQANQALAAPYGKYGGIVQAAGGLIDTSTDIAAGGKIGAADPRMRQIEETKAIMTKVATEVGNTTSSVFYEKLSQALAAKFPEQAQKAADKAAQVKKDEAELAKTQAITAKTEAETVSRTELIKSREATLREKFPKLTDAEVKSIASNDTSFNAYIKPPKDYTPSEYGKMLIEAGYDPDSEKYQQKMAAYAEAKAKPAGDDTATLLLKNEAKRLEIELSEQKLAKEKDKKEIDKYKNKLNFLTGTYQTKRMSGYIKDARDLISKWSTGWGAALFDKLPGSDARQLSNAVKTIKANIGFDKLQQMREASPTGGALGQVSERELEFLQSVLANLDTLTTPEALAKNLEAVDRHYKMFLNLEKAGQHAAKANWTDEQSTKFVEALESGKSYSEALAIGDGTKGGETGTPTPTPDAGGKPKANKRFNPNTGKVEDV